MLLRIGRTVAWVSMALMVLIIVLQVIFRYVFNNALPWPDEAARFLMLWMTGLIAPSAYRWGGFVSIDLVKDMLPLRIGRLLTLCLLFVSLLVLVVGLQYGIKHVNSGWLFASSTLKLPLEFIGLGLVRLKLAWMYMSLPIGIFLMILVNIELSLKSIVGLIDPEQEIPSDQDHLVISAE
ncbi:MAG: TRAP transporter small permease subunit [Hyphomicrobiales bacterium]|nr:TRAP transporter small permease subunit [Hyphomicrobiales bacterium]MCP5001614.1 TRAP transporter small permease subunit [Hyphomicrobiales bacterium]